MLETVLLPMLESTLQSILQIILQSSVDASVIKMEQMILTIGNRWVFLFRFGF